MFRAIGFVIVLVAVRVIMPDVFHGFEQALLTLFKMSERIFAYSPTDVVNMSGAAYVYPHNYPYK